MRADVLLCGPVSRAAVEALVAAGLRTTGPVPSGACLAAARRHQPHLVLVVGHDGAERLTATVRALRSDTDALVVVAGAGDDLDQQVAFAAGADDVVPRGSSERLLLAHVRASAEVE